VKRKWERISEWEGKNKEWLFGSRDHNDQDFLVTVGRNWQKNPSHYD
jgi:hypothetical protein